MQWIAGRLLQRQAATLSLRRLNLSRSGLTARRALDLIDALSSWCVHTCKNTSAHTENTHTHTRIKHTDTDTDTDTSSARAHTHTHKYYRSFITQN